MRAKRIEIEKNTTAEVQVSYPDRQAQICDGRNSRGYMNFVVKGPASISIVKNTKDKTN